mgnify:CR=1 FL=1
MPNKKANIREWKKVDNPYVTIHSKKINTTTMTFIGYGKWRCDYCEVEYSGYTTYCRDGCKKENTTSGK